LDWEQPATDWLEDDRPFVVKRAIDALAEQGKVESLCAAKARLPALWALHRIPGDSARAAIRKFLYDNHPEVRAAAIHSVGLWRDPAAVETLVDMLAAEDHQQRRLAAMALGRIGDKEALRPLLEAGSGEIDAFLRHAIIYALYEIGNRDDLPASHPFVQQARLMVQIDQANPSPQVMPPIQLAEDNEPDPETLARQEARLKELADLVPEGDAIRGKQLFHNTATSLCLTCHVMGDQGVTFGPDLTGIGSIRSKEDLLEAIVYPSASIARYHELVMMQTNEGETGGLILRDTADTVVLAAAPGVEQSVPIKEIKAAKYSNISLMPQVFDGLLASTQIADLVAYLIAAKLPGPASAGEAKPSTEQQIPPHQAVTVPGLHAYAEKSIAAGEQVNFRVSSSVPYQLSVV
jgi:putative heme-binding domain-containing protein